MSYILDALQKSEEERHQGQLPNLGSNSALIHTPKTKSSQWAWIIAALLVLNIGFVGFWVIKESPEANLSQASEYAVSVTQDTVMTNIQVEGAAATKAQVQQPPSTNIEYPTAEKHVIAQQLPANQGYAVKRQPPTVLSAQQTSQPASTNGAYYSEVNHTEVNHTEVKQPGAVNENQVTTRVKSIADVKPLNDVKPVEIIEPSPMLITPKGQSRPYTGPMPSRSESSVSSSESVDRRREPQVESVSHSDIPRVSDKPHEFQIRIPDMAFNSHIYTDIPSARRVMINNIYLKEGQTFSGMKVEKIIEDGIILSLEGQSFKMGVLRDWYSPR